jgi:hypothetical protein
MSDDKSVEPSVPEASGSDTPSVNPERSSVGRMRGGVDPRALARLSVQARRAKKQRRLDGQAQGGGHRSSVQGGGGTSPQRNEARPTDPGSHEPAGSDGFSARERLRWEAKHSPSATARVSAARALLDEEPRQVSEPEPEAPRRGVNLTDVVALAIACGVVDADELLREAKMRAQAMESS